MVSLGIVASVSGEPLLNAAGVGGVCAVVLMCESLILSRLARDRRRRTDATARTVFKLGLLAIGLTLAAGLVYWGFLLDPQKARFSLLYWSLGALFAVLGWTMAALTAISLLAGVVAILMPLRAVQLEISEAPDATGLQAAAPQEQQAIPPSWGTGWRRLSPWLEVFVGLNVANLGVMLLVQMRQMHEAGLAHTGLPYSPAGWTAPGLMALVGILGLLFSWDAARHSRQTGLAFLRLPMVLVGLSFAYDVYWLLVQ